MARVSWIPRLPDPFQKLGHYIRIRLPELNFISLHYAYFILVTLISSVIFWGSSQPLGSVSFTDSLFLCLSAMTETGLNTVNLSQISTFQQIILFILMLMGSMIAVSAFVVFVRLKAFETAFQNFKSDRKEEKAQRKEGGFSRAHAFIPRRLTRARALSTNAEKSRPDAGGRESRKAPTVDSHEMLTRSNSSTSSTVFNNEPKVNTLDGIAEEESGADGTSTTRGRTPQPHLDRGQVQCPSQSPAARDSDHEDHAVPAPPPHISFARRSTFAKHQASDEDYAKVHKPLFSLTGIGASNRSSLRPRATSGMASARHAITPGSQLPIPILRRAATLYDQKAVSHFTATGWMSRNAQFHGLTIEERERLGGREYKCLVFLSFLVPLYYIMWQGLGAISVGAYVKYHQAAAAEANAQNAFWVGSFNAISAFGNSGMSLLDANMVAFQNSAFLLISLGLFILAGNTAYPIFLRAAVWTMWKIIPDDDPQWEDDKRTLRFLLDYPRRVYTNMFPSRQTWWLAAALILLNGIDWLFFEVLSIGDTDIQNLSQTARVLGGLFQAFAVRCGGFYVVPIPTLRLSLQFLYVIMMYISVYPVTMTIRNSNVYEERSLGIFAEDVAERNVSQQAFPDAQTPMTAGSGRIAGLKRRMTQFAAAAAPAPERETRSYFMRQQLRAQLAHDLWFAVLAVFLILIIENSQIERDPVSFSVFNVVFEVISAYGTVGLSVGVPNNAYSFCGSWHKLSKLVLCAVMLRGRHRGLPVAIDHAIQLPGSRMWEAEDEDGEKRLDKIESLERVQSIARNELPTIILKSPTALRDNQLRERMQAPRREDV